MQPVSDVRFGWIKPSYEAGEAGICSRRSASTIFTAADARPFFDYL